MSSLALMMVAGAATAAPTTSLIWNHTGTSSHGAVAAGTVLTLDIYIAGNDVPIYGGSVSLDWDPAEYTAVPSSAVECPSPPNLSPGICTPNGDFSVLWQPPIPGVTIDAVNGVASSFDAVAGGPTGFSTNQTLIGRMQFTVNSPGAIDLVYLGPDGIVVLGGAVYPISSTMIPEPSTMGLLALGLGVLGMVGRGRS